MIRYILKEIIQLQHLKIYSSLYFQRNIFTQDIIVYIFKHIEFIQAQLIYKIQTLKHIQHFESIYIYIQQTSRQRMGNQHSSTPQSTELHQRLGPIKVSQSTDQYGEVYEEMSIDRLVQTEKDIQSWQRHILKYDDTLIREVILLPNKFVFEGTGMCGSAGVVHLKYDHYPYVLQSQIENRKSLGRYFLETQMWYLLYNLVRPASKFEKYRAKIGDVHPKNIIINDEGQAKLISVLSLPLEVDNFQKMIQQPATAISPCSYLAPQQLENQALFKNIYNKNIDPSRAECFSIGLTILSAGTLENPATSVYLKSNQSGWKIQRIKINMLLKEFGQKYSSFMHNIVMGLLAEKPSDRKKASEIYQGLYEYQQKILDLDSFLPDNSRMPSYSNANYGMVEARNSQSNNVIANNIAGNARMQNNSSNVNYNNNRETIYNNRESIYNNNREPVYNNNREPIQNSNFSNKNNAIKSPLKMAQQNINTRYSKLPQKMSQMPNNVNSYYKEQQSRKSNAIYQQPTINEKLNSNTINQKYNISQSSFEPSPQFNNNRVISYSNQMTGNQLYESGLNSKGHVESVYRSTSNNGPYQVVRGQGPYQS